MKKLILTSVLLCGLLSTAVFAADTNTVSGGLFNAKEFSLSLGSGYAVDTAAAFKQPYTVNAQAGAQFFLTRSFGVEAAVPFYASKGVSVSEVQADLVLRLPLSRTAPLFKNIAPYVGAGGVYNWDTAENWAYIGKAGVEFRVNKHWGVFGEWLYRNNSTTWSAGQNSVGGGLRLVF